MGRGQIENRCRKQFTYFPGSTLNTDPLHQWYTAAMVHATPIPRKTFTALLPVTLPTLASAYLSCMAATLLANVSDAGKEIEEEIKSILKSCKVAKLNERRCRHSPGMLVPRATNTMAVTESLIPSVHPKCDATSPITAVTTPIEKMDTTKHK